MSWPDEFAARYRERGYWRGETLWQLLADSAVRYAERVAVVDGDRRWTYAELAERAERTAGGLHALGVRSGDRVVVQLGNIAEFFETVFALFRMGALPVFALPAHRLAEIGYFCAFTEASAYVVEDALRELAARVAGQRPEMRVIMVGEAGLDSLRGEPYRGPRPSAADVAFLQLSGGSTGTPKLIPRTHDDYFYSVRASAAICELSERSVYLVALPAAHNFPLSSPGTLGVLHTGGTVVLAGKPTPELAFELIERERVTITSVVPPLALVWMAAARNTTRDLRSLDVLQVGGAKFGSQAAARVTAELGCRLQQVFGMAEGLVNYTRLGDPEDLVIGTQGRPISPDDELRIVDERDNEVAEGATGELLTRGPYTIRGYYRAAEHNQLAFTEDGFYRTGDLVRLTPEGYLVVEGRVKDQINRGGEKIAPEEVENHLLAHDGVHDAAMVSMPDAHLGERSCVFVILNDSKYFTGRRPAGELRAFLRTRGLAEYKLPDRVEVVEEFPPTGVGKVGKKDLRAAIARKLGGGR